VDLRSGVNAPAAAESVVSTTEPPWQWVVQQRGAELPADVWVTAVDRVGNSSAAMRAGPGPS
jgi:hypothetical protein